ncbi:MAG TPA: AMP-binding protein, partial [Longimicrobium sp.]|nr:AMP-binding protein [Longimicrobium sp.]
AHLPDLRVVATGGEACTADLVHRWGAGRRFFNVYGPTECSVRAAAGEPRPGGGAPSIGRPLPNSRVHVVGADGFPSAAGAEGELCIGGIGVARGYLGHPALTATAFVPDPFSGRPGARLYRSGDRARWTPTGELEFLGRLDDQVKIRGFRVEPGEVTAALRAVPGVREAAVVARKDGEVRLVAYFAGDESLTAATLRAALERRLLDHMVPSAFVRVAAIPLTAHGKVDRRALPEPEEGGEAGPSLDAILRVARVSVDEQHFVPVHRLAPRTESRAEDADADARANRLARRLIRMTGGAGERIAVALPSSEHLGVAVLGVLKAGAVCIIPNEHDGSLLREAALVVTTRATAAALHLPTAVLSLDADAELLSRESSSPPYVAVAADAAAVVISGIAISHALLAAVVKLDAAMLRSVPVLARLARAVDGSGG